MVVLIKFTIPGEATAQGRPRAGKTKTGKTRMYDPQKSKDYKSYVRLVASQYMPKNQLEGQISMHLKIYRQIPKSMTKKLRKASIEEIHRPITKPDCSNIAKGIEDALNGLIYKDDSQIVDLHVSKFYSENPRVEVVINTLERVV